MMSKKLIYLSICLFSHVFAFAQNDKQEFVSTDIENFWLAYEKIISTKDSLEQGRYLQEFYLKKGSDGLKSLIEVRNYSEKELIDAMIQYPKFWVSLKPNTLNVKELYPEIEADIQKLKQAYPNLKPSTIYFSFGAFRTNGTIQGNRVLIGSEMVLADNTTIINELPEVRQAYYQEYRLIAPNLGNL